MEHTLETSGSRMPAAAPASAESVLCVLDEDALAELLRAAKRARALASLASTSRQLCRMARSRGPVQLRVSNQQQAALVMKSHARGGYRAFSGCTRLVVTAADKACTLLVGGVLSAARQWPALQQVDLILQPRFGQQRPLLPLDYQTSSVLSGVFAVQQLQRLVLDVPEFGECSAAITGQLVQLTKLQLTARGPAADAAADLTALSAMTNLVELVLRRQPAVQPAASAAGPYCLPSSLRRLEIQSVAAGSNAEEIPSVAPWVTHLPGCPHLQHFQLFYDGRDHPSAHPSKVVRLLAQHIKGLRSLVLAMPSDMEWDSSVPGLPDAVLVPAERQWRPDAGLAALTGLQHLAAELDLHLLDQIDWRHLAQLTALTKLSHVVISVAPWLQTGASLVLVELEGCQVHLSGHGLGRVLLACPLLEQAEIRLSPPSFREWAPPAAGQPLPPHPSLKRLKLCCCEAWGGAATAAGRFSELAGVLWRVPDVALWDWPLLSVSDTGPSLPDLSGCTALTSLAFGCVSTSTAGMEQVVYAEQEDFLSMLGPLQQLTHLWLAYAPGFNARAVVPLQLMLPRLQLVTLAFCGKLLRVAAGSPQLQEDEEQQQQQEEEEEEDEKQQMLLKVKQLLRPGLVLQVA